jgi:hypothetical protein
LSTSRGRCGVLRADPSCADVGAGLRIRVPGWGRVLRLDVAHGLTDGANAFTVGFSLAY